ncbi:hypothetical protein RSAG8_10788, partial [Rhizoctonia solani AG-8 WAC10335]
MSNLHAYFHLRNLGAFRQLFDAHGVSGNRVPDGKSGSGPRSWSQTQAQMTAIAQSGQLDNNPNIRDALGRTVLHLACADLAPIALEFVRALLALPSGQIDVNAQDTESGWTALHRALYAGNLPAATLLLGRSDIDTGIRDLEGMTSFDVYNATIEGTVPESLPSIPRELWVWGSNRNATLGTRSADDRAYPEAISPVRPAEVVEKLSGSARFGSIGVREIAMSRLHWTPLYMSNLHAYFHLRNLGAFRQLFDARGVSGNRVPDGKSGSGSRSWSQTQAQMTAIAQSGQLDNNPNLRDALGRTVLHLACADLAPIALEFVRALLALPSGQIDVNAQDTESGWTALHRALYAGNLPAATLLLGRSDIDTGIRDLEGMSSFDVYNATIEGTVPESLPSIPRELWVWGSNRNATLGTGSADDRAYPEAISPVRTAEVVEKLSGSARFGSIGVREIAMSRLHTCILTNEARGNLEACGFGGVGRLGTKQHTQYSFGKVAGLENQTIVRVALGLDHTLALTSNGDVLSWGMNRFHQLGYAIELIDSSGKTKANVDPSENQVQVSPKRVVGNNPSERDRDGDVLSWGMNRFHQLGYVIELIDSSGKTKANVDPSENQVQVSPKRVVGPLRKETVVGIAACKTASVCWTSGDLYSWGTNSGQLGYAKATPGWQVLPRKVATISKVVDVALSDIAMVCLLPTKEIMCFWNGAHFRIQFPQPVFPHRYQPPVTATVTCNDTVFAALTTAGEVFLFTLPDSPTSETDSSPNVRPQKVWALRRQVAATDSSPNVRPQKVWALRRQVAAVCDIALGGDGTIIVCTASGHVFVHAPKPVKGPNIASGVAGSGVGSALLSGPVRTHKYQRVFGLQRIVNVAANSTGGFAALRADAIIEPLIIEGKSMAEAIGNVQPYLAELQDEAHSFDLLLAMNQGDEDDEEHDGIFDDIILAEQLCRVVIQSRKENGFPSVLDHHVLHGADMRISGAINIPVHRAVIAARSLVLENVLSGKPLTREGLVFKYSEKTTTLAVSGCHALSILVLLNYLYSDTVCPIWDHRVRLPIAPSLALIKAQPGDIRLELQRLSRVLELSQLQTAVDSIGKRTPAPTLGSDFARLFQSSGQWNMCSDFVQSVEEFIDFIFRVMSAANELMLEQLTEICSMVILRHITLTNCITVLADASPFYCPKLKARLHKYIAVNMESLMEKRYLDDVAHDVMKELAIFVRGQQALKQPHTRSGAWIAAIMERHKGWLATQDFPSVVVRTAPPGRQPKLSPKQSPTIGPTSPKTPRRVSSFNLPVTPQRSNATKSADKTPQCDGMFSMDEENVGPTPGDSSIRVEPPTVPLPELPPIASSSGPSSKVWKGTKTGRVDMRSIMADEAVSSRPTRSPMVRITGFDSANQPPSPSKPPRIPRLLARDPHVPPWSGLLDLTRPTNHRHLVNPRGKTELKHLPGKPANFQLVTPPASASSSWRDPPATSGSPAQRQSETKLRPGEFPSLFEGSSRQRVPSTAMAQPVGPSPSLVPKPSAQQPSSVKPKNTLAPAPAPAPAFPGLGPVIVPKRSTGGAESSKRRNVSDAWTAPPPMPSSPPKPSGSVSFSEIQQQQHALPLYMLMWNLAYDFSKLSFL